MRIARLLPYQSGKSGRVSGGTRSFVGAVLWYAKTGALWRDRPARFGK